LNIDIFFMNDQELAKTLQLIKDKISGIDYALIGTLNLKFQGLPVIPKDIDFLTDNEGVKKVSQIFQTEISDDNRCLESSFNLNGIEIHFVSNDFNPVRPPDFRGHMLIVKKYNLEIPCMSLDSELAAYKKMGREKDKDKIKLLEEKIAKN
jgi:hypothetical protein